MEETERQRPRALGIVGVVVVSMVVLIVAICCGIPLVTGQMCFDFLSGHVPPRAARHFLDGVFTASVAENYDWLATVSTPDALEDLRTVQPHVTTGYEIILSDNMLGMYEYRIRFDNGATVYVTLTGRWPSCPDFIVTEREIYQNIQLQSIRLESE
jgi:hypothetical protein